MSVLGEQARHAGLLAELQETNRLLLLILQELRETKVNWK